MENKDSKQSSSPPGLNSLAIAGPSGVGVASGGVIRRPQWHVVQDQPFGVLPTGGSVPFETSSSSSLNASSVLNPDGTRSPPHPHILFRRYTHEDEVALHVEHNMVVRRPSSVVHEFTVDEVTFYAELTSRYRCRIQNCGGHFRYGMVVKFNLPVEFLKHNFGEVPKYWPYVAKACLPYRIPADREELMGGIRWHTLTPRPLPGRSIAQVGMKNTCMIDGWLTDIKLRTLDVNCCLGCWFVHTSGPGLKIEKTLRTISKFILTCASPEPDASGSTQILKEFTHEQELYIKTIWFREKFTAFRTEDYEVTRRGVKIRNKLVDLMDIDAEPSDAELVTRMSMHR